MLNSPSLKSENVLQFCVSLQLRRGSRLKNPPVGALVVIPHNHNGKYLIIYNNAIFEPTYKYNINK